MADSLSIRAYAKQRGVSHVAVLRALREGRIESESDGTINPVVADTAWAANTRPRAGGRKPRSSGHRSDSPTVAESQRRLLAAKAARERLRLRQERGELVSAADVRAEAFATGRRVRDSVLALPAQLAAELAVLTDPAEVQRKLDAELRQALDSLSGCR